MYINPTDQQAARVPLKPKKHKGGQNSSFAEEVSNLLELDSVEITAPDKKHHNGGKRFSHQHQGDSKHGAQEDNSESNEKPNLGGELSITA